MRFKWYWAVLLPLLTHYLGCVHGDSFAELRQLMMQQSEQAALFQQFDTDIKSWLSDLDQFGLDFLQLVEHCRQLRSHCEQRRVQRKLRTLRRGYSELRMQLEGLEQQYADRFSDQSVVEPALVAVRALLQQYEETLRLVNAQSYKLVNQ